MCAVRKLNKKELQIYNVFTRLSTYTAPAPPSNLVQSKHTPTVLQTQQIYIFCPTCNIDKIKLVQKVSLAFGKKVPTAGDASISSGLSVCAKEPVILEWKAIAEAMCRRGRGRTVMKSVAYKEDERAPWSLSFYFPRARTLSVGAENIECGSDLDSWNGSW